jgi:hypothetical protein
MEQTFIVFRSGLVNNRAMLKTSEIKHSYAPVCTTAHEHISTIRAEPNIIYFFVMGDELCFRGQSGYVPNRTCCIDARGDNQ